jgi:hypothetical protein
LSRVELASISTNTTSVHLNVEQGRNGRGNYTGERLARERPKVYRQIIELLAQGVSLVPVFGVSVDKLVALSNDPMQVQVSHTQTHDLGRNLYARLEQLAQRLQPTPVHAACVNEAQSLPNGDTVPDSGAENGVNPGEEAAKKAQVNRPQD